MKLGNYCHAHRHGRGPHEPIDVDENTPSVIRGQEAESRDRTQVYRLQFCRHCGGAFLTVEPKA